MEKYLPLDLFRLQRLVVVLHLLLHFAPRRVRDVNFRSPSLAHLRSFRSFSLLERNRVGRKLENVRVTFEAIKRALTGVICQISLQYTLLLEYTPHDQLNTSQLRRSKKKLFSYGKRRYKVSDTKISANML